MDGILYTYEHVEKGFKLDNDELAYVVTCKVEYADETPTHLNTYYVPAERLYDFLESMLTETGEEVLDIRPIKKADIPKLLQEFKYERTGE